MSYLLDTSSFLWFVHDDRRLSATAAAIIESSDSEIYLSVASIWEIAIKVNLRRGLALRRPFPEFIDHQLDSNRFELLDISVEHLKRVANLAPFHRDPFDRSAHRAEPMSRIIPLISSDAAFDLYDVQRFW